MKMTIDFNDNDKSIFLEIISDVHLNGKYASDVKYVSNSVKYEGHTHKVYGC